MNSKRASMLIRWLCVWGMAGAVVLAGCAGGPASAPAMSSPVPSAIVAVAPSPGASCSDRIDDTNAPAPAAPDAGMNDADDRGAGSQELPMKFNPTGPLAYDLASNTIVLGG